jgi:UDP-glucose 4-epimerase
LNPQKILITGGSGFIGSNLVHYQNLLGKDVTVFDLQPFPTAATSKDQPRNVVIGDITEAESIENAVTGMDAIVHLAAQTGVPSSIQDPVTDCLTNVVGTMRVLEAARKTGVNKVVIASSAAPLGRAKPPASENTVPLPISPYGASKLSAEAYCLAYFGSYGINAIALRFANAYGERAGHKESVVSKFMKDILTTREIAIDGTGGQTRDFIHVSDLCSAIESAMNFDGGGEIFQIGTGTETSISDLANLIVDASKFDVNVSYGPTRAGDVLRNYSDISKAKKMMNWSPQKELNLGISQVWEWFEANVSPTN